MNELEAIETSLANFTRRFEEISSDTFNALRESSFFAPVPGEHLAIIAQQIELKHYQEGQHLICKGDTANAFYVILFGSASAQVNDKIVGTIHSGECLGESAFFSHENASRSATVSADSEVIVAKLERSGIEQLPAETRHHLDKALLLAIFKKLQQANGRIEQLLR